MLAYITALIIVETIFVAVQARTVQLTYIDNRNYPGGPWVWFLNSQSLAVNVMFEATLFILTFLSDLLVVSIVSVVTDMSGSTLPSQVWRCWVIWRAAGRMQAILATSIPTLVLLASFGMSYHTRHSQFQSTQLSLIRTPAVGTLWVLQSSEPGLSFYSALPEAFGISYYTTSLAVNIVVTILIAIRLYVFRRSIIATLPASHAAHYVSLGTVIVESAGEY